MLKEISPFIFVRSSTVDGKLWHTVECDVKTSAWLRGQPSEQWIEHPEKSTRVYSNYFDVTDLMYDFLKLTWL